MVEISELRRNVCLIWQFLCPDSGNNYILFKHFKYYTDLLATRLQRQKHIDIHYTQTVLQAVFSLYGRRLLLYLISSENNVPLFLSDSEGCSTLWNYVNCLKECRITTPQGNDCLILPCKSECVLQDCSYTQPTLFCLQPFSGLTE